MRMLSKNIPNMLTSITSVLAKENINIENLLNKSRGDYAYTMLDFDGGDTTHILESLNEIEGMIKIRII